MPLSNIIGIPITFNRMLVGQRTGDATYNTPVTVFGNITGTFDINNASGELFTNGEFTAATTRMQGGTVELEMAMPDFDVLAEVLGLSVTSTGAEVDGDRVNKLTITSKNLPYIGLAGSAEDDSGTDNAFHMFAPRAKITSDTVTVVNVTGGDTPEYPTASITLSVFPDEAYVVNQASEVQNLDLGGATAGTYTLTFGASETASIDFDATASEVQTALEALNSIGSGNVAVAVASGSGDFDITFQGTLANLNLPELVLDDTSLTGASGAAVTTTTQGNRGQNGIYNFYEVEAGTAITLPPAL